MLAALRALDAIAAATELVPLHCTFTVIALADAVFDQRAPPLLYAFNEILDSWVTRPEDGDAGRIRLEQVNMVTRLIAALCREERHRAALASDSILYPLSALLASVAVRDIVEDGNQLREDERPGKNDIPLPAHTSLRLVPLLDSIAIIIGDSIYRMRKFVWSPAIQATFSNHGLFSIRPQESDWWMPKRYKLLIRTKGSNQPIHRPTVKSASGTPRVATDNILGHQMPNDEAIMEALRESLATTPGLAAGIGRNKPSEAVQEWEESQFVPWLIYQLRLQLDDKVRVACLHLLSCCIMARPGTSAREMSTIGMLVMPPAMDLLRGPDIVPMMSAPQPPPNNTTTESAMDWYILRRIPLMIARLVIDSEPLQKAAAENKVIPLLSGLLKKAFSTTIARIELKVWNPARDEFYGVELPPSRTMGDSGRSTVEVEVARVREAILDAMAAVAAEKEEYRKGFGLEGIIQTVAQAVSLNQTRTAEEKRRLRQLAKLGSDNTKDGKRRASAMDDDDDDDELGVDGADDSDSDSDVNMDTSTTTVTPSMVAPIQRRDPVVIAACHVVRILSRSPHLLRTFMVESDLTASVYKLLSHPDVDTRIVASAVMCNLTIRVSPSRDVSCCFMLCLEVVVHDADFTETGQCGVASYAVQAGTYRQLSSTP